MPKATKKIVRKNYSTSFINLPRRTYVQVGVMALILTAVFYTTQLLGGSQDSRSRASSSEPGTQVLLVGDLNHDGKVDGMDVSILRSKMGTYDAEADLNHDGQVDKTDLSILLGLLQN